MKIAIATQEGYVSKWPEDERFEDALKAKMISKGIEGTVERVDWNDTSVNFLGYDVIFVSSTWNFHEKPKAFLAWLDHCESDGVKRLINDKEIMKRCVDKKDYFEGLCRQFGMTDCQAGSITPTIFLNAGESRCIDDILSDKGWAEVVIKPRTAADGHGVLCFGKNSLITNDKIKPWQEADAHLREILNNATNNGAIIQPMVASVCRQGVKTYHPSSYGEFQLVFINGEYSHASGKPKVFAYPHSDNRKYIEQKALPPGMLDFAKNIVKYFNVEGRAQARIRVDLFLGEHGPVLNEAEAMEPNCNTRVLVDEGLTGELEKALARITDCILTRGADYQQRRQQAAAGRVLEGKLLTQGPGGNSQPTQANPASGTVKAIHARY